MSCFFLAWALLLFAKQIEALEGCSVSWDSTEVGVLLQTRRENAKASLALNSSSFSASRGTGVALVAVPAPLTGRHSTGIFHYGLWSRVHWTHHELPKNWQLQNVLRSAEVFDWTCLAVAFTGAFVLRSLWLWQDPEKPRVSHLASMGLWVLMAALMGFAMWLRFGQEAGMNWTAGYIFELFFMLENVFVFRYVIHVMSLPPRVLLRVLDGVVWAQITFEAVFFLGLAHQLRSVHFLPHLLGTGLAIFGVSTLVESAKSEGDGVMSSVIKSVTSSSSIRAVEGASEEGSFVTLQGMRLHLTTAGTVLVLLLIIDFMCEIDTVLTKIEEIPNPFVAFSSSAMAAFALPELFLLSQDLLRHFPLVKCGIGLILCFLGVQLILARLVVIQPLVTCGVMIGTILVFVLLSAVVEKSEPDESAATVS